MAAFLQNHHIALALETPVLTGLQTCPPNLGHKPWMATLTDRLARLHIRLDLLAMVGPLVDTVIKSPAHGCRNTLAQAAADAATSVKWIRLNFPSLVVGEIEPSGDAEHSPTPNQLTAWFDAFAAASGQRPAFLHFDVAWGSDWRTRLPAALQAAAQASIPYGVIYNASPSALSDATALDEMLHNAADVEALLPASAPELVFQSWEDFPRRLLPETIPTTFTGTIDRYFRPATRLVRQPGGKWRLLDPAGAPVANAIVLLQRQSVDSSGALQPQTLSGIVPHGAVSARVGVRIHVECACPANPAKIAVSNMSFDQNNSRRPVSVPGGRQGVLSRSLLPAVGFLANGDLFPVIPDAPFRLDFHAWVGPESDHTGFVALIFNNEQGTEIRRALAWLSSTWRTLSVVHTSASGEIGFDAGTLTGPVRLVFQGTAQAAPVAATLSP